MKIVAITAAVLVASTNIAAQADPFLVELPQDWGHVSNQKLREQLHLTELEAHRMPGAIFLVVDAINEAYVEAYFRASGASNAKISPIKLIHRSAVEALDFTEGKYGPAVVLTWTLGEEIAPFQPGPLN